MTSFINNGDLPLLDIARGKVRNASIRNLFGTTGDDAHIVTEIAGGYRTPWEVASDYTFPSSALTMSLVSSSASDTSVSVLLIGLDADYEPIQEVVALNGTTSVTTSIPFFRINDAVVSSGNAVGNITISNGGTTYAKILAGTGRDQKAVYTVPAGHCFFLMRIDAFCTDSNGGKAAQFRNFSGLSDGRILRVADTTFFENMQILRQAPFKYDQKTDVKMQLKSLSGSVYGSIFAEGILIKDDSFSEWSEGY